MSHVLVTGGYGLIGAHVVRALRNLGHMVTVLGRSRYTAARTLPTTRFLEADISTLRLDQDWAPVLDGITHVVNCAGALQDSPSDRLETLHHLAVRAMAAACHARTIPITQISAAGASESATTEFLRSKARGDSALLQSGATVHILRPGMVIAPDAYGGTMLLRLLAAVPLIQPLALPDSRIQCIGIKDLTCAICETISCADGSGSIQDLVEPRPHKLADIVAAHRRWLGFSPARVTITLPDWLLTLTAKGADGLGLLGWKSPLRSTSIAILRDGIIGDRTTSPAVIRPLDEILSSQSVGREHRLQARLDLLLPFLIAVLALFWISSGVIGLIRYDTAHQQLDWPDGPAQAAVIFWSLVDIALGLAVLIRKWVTQALWGMTATCLIYLGFGSILTPELWLDPLGPLLKILPILMLSLATLPMVEAR